MKARLRIDVDTLRGTRLGVPRLLSLLDAHGLTATFFFSVGPDNMGRHIRRLLRPAFLWKMLRTRAPSLYGWSILRCGVVGDGPDIGASCGAIMRAVAAAGHETGLHAWDHHRWQTMDLTDGEAVDRELRRGVERFTDIFGFPPACSAAPAWRAGETTVAAKASFPFAYNSDCRGDGAFVPLLAGGALAPQPQIPVTLPTYDEMLGRAGVDDGVYNARLLDRFRPESENVLCIHAEVEGIAKHDLFADFLRSAREMGIAFTRLDAMLANRPPLPVCRLTQETIPGREGFVCVQARPGTGRPPRAAEE